MPSCVCVYSCMCACLHIYVCIHVCLCMYASDVCLACWKSFLLPINFLFFSSSTVLSLFSVT